MFPSTWCCPLLSLQHLHTQQTINMIKCPLLSLQHLQTYTLIKLSDNVKIITNHGHEITLDGKLNGKSCTEICRLQST